MGAMELTVEETAFLHRIAARWKRENLREAQAMSMRIARRRETAWKVIDSLTAEFQRRDEHLMRVVLFGSLARDELLNDRFDIDLAVESSCCSDLLSITMDHDFPVDLLDLTCAGSHIMRRIEIEGKELYRAEC